MEMNKDFIRDEIYGDRLLISVNADQRELHSNIRAARAILHSFVNASVQTRQEIMSVIEMLNPGTSSY
jgi:hypothetical protein